MHLTPVDHLLFAHNRNVIFGLTGNHTGITTITSAQVNGHAPGIFGIVHLGIEGDRFAVMIHFVNKFRFGGKLGHSAGTNQVAPFHAVMHLRAGKLIAVTHLAHGQAVAKPGHRGRA